MDYEVFLVSRIREDFVHNGDARVGVIEGLRHSSRVIVAAGRIMIAVFTAFVFTPGAEIKMIGFALATGVLADAFLVRMTIVPAVLALLGERAWRLPAWLDQILPNVDIEGESLGVFLAAEQAARDRETSVDEAARVFVDRVADKIRTAHHLDPNHDHGLELDVVVNYAADAGAGIVEAAGQHGVDMVVMATHGRSGISRWLTGSVTEHVIRESPVPVVAVPAW